MWKKSIDCDPNYLTQAETFEKIAALYYKRGDLKNYALYMSKMSEAKDSLYTRKKKYNMSELQSNINTWTKQDYELCMAYCKIEFAETMAEIEHCYGKIAPRKQLIMLLQHLNYDYAATGRVLGINSDSVRKNIARITPLTK